MYITDDESHLFTYEILLRFQVFYVSNSDKIIKTICDVSFTKKPFKIVISNIVQGPVGMSKLGGVLNLAVFEESKHSKQFCLFKYSFGKAKIRFFLEGGGLA